MLRFATVLTAILLMAFQVAPPTLPPRLAALADDVGAARDFDYMALKAEGADLKMLADAVHMRARPQDDQIRRCLTEAEQELQTNLSAAALAPDAAAFAADRVAAGEALAKWGALEVRMQGGEEFAEQPLRSASRRFMHAQQAYDPRVRELARRTGVDQFNRFAFTEGAKVWGELSPGALSRAHSEISHRLCEIDKSNTEWLKADLRANGWFVASRFDQAASGYAWLITQHADNDPAFQREVLAILEPMVATGETSASNFAYLYDRVAVGSGRPQRYGTQGTCTATNVWTPDPLEDPDRVETLRAAVGIDTLAEYQAHMHSFCADFTG